LALYHEKRVLLVDIDPQTNLTFLCAVQHRWQQYKNRGGGTIVSLYKRYLEGKEVDISKGIWKSPIQSRDGDPLASNLDLIPSDLELLVDQDVKVLGSTKLSKANPLAVQVSEIKIRAEHYVIPRIFLKQVLKQCDKDYDYVLIDCPPNLYLLTQNALLSSQYYIITALPDHLSTIGMRQLINRADDLSNLLISHGKLIGQILSKPEVGGIIFVRVLRQQLTRIHAETMDKVRHDYRDLVFNDNTTELTGYQEASVDAMPVFLYRSANAKRAADQYLAITDEFVRRFP
jgi:chromosome partitioning protein